MATEEQPDPQSPTSRELADILEALRAQRRFLRHTTRDLTDEQAAMRTTVSELCLGGIVKHVAVVERAWTRFIVDGPAHMAFSPERMEEHSRSFQMEDGETLAGILDLYEQVAAETEEIVTSHPDLDASQPLPEAPWFEPGARRTTRRTLLHILAETAQHSGHADIVREGLDGAKTMG